MSFDTTPFTSMMTTTLLVPRMGRGDRVYTYRDFRVALTHHCRLTGLTDCPQVQSLPQKPTSAVRQRHAPLSERRIAHGSFATLLLYLCDRRREDKTDIYCAAAYFATPRLSCLWARGDPRSIRSRQMELGYCRRSGCDLQRGNGMSIRVHGIQNILWRMYCMYVGRCSARLPQRPSGKTNESASPANRRARYSKDSIVRCQRRSGGVMCDSSSLTDRCTIQFSTAACNVRDGEVE
jgi:hypothetical protein